MHTKYALLLALKIAVILVGLVWIYTFISFAFSLISFLLEIASTLASEVCYIFRFFVETFFFLLIAIIRIAILLIKWVFIILAGLLSVPIMQAALDQILKNGTKWLNPNDLRTEHIHWDNPDAPICPEFILGKCKNGSQCTGHHCILPYQWQYINCDDHEWKNLNEEDNERLEKMYCDVTLEECLNTGIQKSFESGELLHAQETYDINIWLDDKTLIIQNSELAMIKSKKFLRRLSTESYVNSSNPLVTKWIWYWQHESGFWRMYDQDDTGKDLQESLEKAFWNKQKDFRFRIKSRDYILTFDSSSSMSQTNMNYRTRKTVRRRPGKFFSKDDISQLKRSQKAFPAHNQPEGNTRGSDKPSHWSQMPSTRPYQRVRLSPNTDEFKEIENLFKNSFIWGVEILAIERVQNPFEWEKYQRKKENMAAAHTGFAVERFVNERRLFHGTNPEVVEAICKQNFDWRVNGKNGTAYGQGSYFAVDSSKSDGYAKEDNKGSKFMFVAKVLAGSYTEGLPRYQRPPSKTDPWDPASDLYDSCVDNTLCPTIFVVFQNDQLYPEYIVEYSTVRGGYQYPVTRPPVPAISPAEIAVATNALIRCVRLLFGQRN